MVRSRIGEHADINRRKLTEAIKIFGKTTLALRKVTETVDAFGQLTASSTADTTFTGDLQFGLDIDERFIKTGMVDVGDAVLYIHPDALSTLPTPEDIVVDDTNSEWRIHSQIESPELDGTVCHYSYRCTREINSGDS